MKKFAFLVILSFLFLNACGDGTADSWEGTNTIVLHMAANPTTLNTVSATDGYAHVIHDYVFDALVYTGSNLEPIPWVATNWTWDTEFYPGEWEEVETVITNGMTNTVTNMIQGTVSNYILTFYMRNDVYWHDGEPFTAHDMVFTYEKIMDPVYKAFNKFPKFDGIVRSVTALDDYTLQVVYNQPVAMAVPSWNIFPLPKHIYEQYETAEEFHASPYNRAPIGNGAYYMKEWKNGQLIVLEQNTNYWREAPHFERIVYRIIVDDNTSHTAFRKGLLDVYSLEKEKYMSDKDEPYYVTNYNTYFPLYFGYSLIAWNLREGSIFTDKKVRTAMAYSLNREEIAEKVLYGFSFPVSGPFAYNTYAYNHEVEPIPYDLEKAAELLAEAGWADTDNDGILDKDGVPFEFDIMYGESSQTTTIALQLQENLLKLGIKMNNRSLEWSVIDQSITSGDFDAIMFAWSLDDDPSPYDIFHSSQIDIGINVNAYSNAVVDDLIIQARREFDIDKRTEIYHKIHELIAEDQPYMFLFGSELPVAISKEVQGVTIGVRGLSWWYPGFHNWYKVDLSE